MDDLDELLNDMEVRASMGGLNNAPTPNNSSADLQYPRKSTQLVKLTNELLDLDDLVSNIPTAQEVAYGRPSPKKISFSPAPTPAPAPAPAPTPSYSKPVAAKAPVSPRAQEFAAAPKPPVSPRGQDKPPASPRSQDAPPSQAMLKSFDKNKKRGFDVDMLEELNKLRMDPPGYAASLEEFKESFVDALSWKIPSAPIVLDTVEGKAAIDETIKLLKSLKPLPPFTRVSEPLSRAMQDLCNENGKTGSTDLDGSADRFIKYGKYVGKIRELATFGTAVAKEAIWGWLVSDGDKSRVNQKTLLDPDMRVIGVARAKHNSPYLNMIAVAICVDYQEGETSLKTQSPTLALSEEDKYYLVSHPCTATAKEQLELVHKANLLLLTETIGTNKIYHKWKLPWYFPPGSVAGKYSAATKTLRIIMAKEIGVESKNQQVIGSLNIKGNPSSTSEVLVVDSEQVTAEKRDHFITILPSKYDEDVNIVLMGDQTLVFEIVNKKEKNKPEKYVLRMRIPFPPKKISVRPGGPPYKLCSDKPVNQVLEAVLVPISD